MANSGDSGFARQFFGNVVFDRFEQRFGLFFLRIAAIDDYPVWFCARFLPQISLWVLTGYFDQVDEIPGVCIPGLD